MGLFVLFPLVCTIAIAFTNYSSTNQLTFERAQEVLLIARQAGKTYNFGLYPAGDEWQLALSDGETGKITSPTRLNLAASKTATERNDRPARRRTRESARDYPESSGTGDITAILPDGNKVMMSSLRQFSGTQPLYTLDGVDE